MKQVFSGIGQQVAQDCDPWEKGNQQSEPYTRLAFFLQPVSGP